MRHRSRYSRKKQWREDAEIQPEKTKNRRRRRKKAILATMAPVFPGQLSAAQVGSCFATSYYICLLENPNLVHQFYSDASTMARYDGATDENASGRAEIHNLISSLHFTEMEIKTVHSLESLDGGVLVTVTGLMKAQDFIRRRKFVETFFLATQPTQENGYFVLNDAFVLIEEEQVLQQSQDDYDTNLDLLNPVQEPASSYMLEEDISAENSLSPPLPADENDTIDNVSVSGETNRAPDHDERVDETPVELPTISFSSLPNAVRDSPAPAEEPVGEAPKHTYASILRTAQAQAAPHLISMNKTAPFVSEWYHAPQETEQQVQPIVQDKSSSEVLDEASVFEDEDESKSVYVGNLPASISTSDLEQEFKTFGRIKPEGISIRSRKVTGFYYAFIEFEDAVGVQNALKASPVQLNGSLIHVESRRPNSGSSRRRRSRGRRCYNSEAPRDRFGEWPFRRGGSIGGLILDDDDIDLYKRSNGNGHLQRGPPRRN